MKIVTSATVWNDAVGVRMSITYSEVDEETGKVISDNKRADRIVTDAETKGKIESVMAKAQEFVDSI